MILYLCINKPIQLNWYKKNKIYLKNLESNLSMNRKQERLFLFKLHSLKTILKASGNLFLYELRGVSSFDSFPFT